MFTFGRFTVTETTPVSFFKITIDVPPLVKIQDLKSDHSLTSLTHPLHSLTFHNKLGAVVPRTSLPTIKVMRTRVYSEGHLPGIK